MQFHHKYVYSFLWLLACSVLIFSCQTDPVIQSDVYQLNIPKGFSMPEIPEDNPLTAEKIALGKKLFYDVALSVDSTISCAGCHRPENAFSDRVAISEGVDHLKGFRNAPTLANLAWAPLLLKDGGNPTLESQIFIPVETHFEMGFNMLLLTQRLQTDPVYVNEFYDVFGTAIDPFSITRAIAAFERTMISGNARYDEYINGNVTLLNASEINGMNLFMSDALNCSSCHGGFLFTDHSFQNNGYFSDYSADSGRARITWLHSDAGKFRVPTLRNIELTAPYMHDGSVGSLEEIIDQYATGGTQYENQSSEIRSFTVTPQEKVDLINFLKSLTDENFISNPELIE